MTLQQLKYVVTVADKGIIFLWYHKNYIVLISNSRYNKDN